MSAADSFVSKIKSYNSSYLAFSGIFKVNSHLVTLYRSNALKYGTLTRIAGILLNYKLLDVHNGCPPPITTSITDT